MKIKELISTMDDELTITINVKSSVSDKYITLFDGYVLELNTLLEEEKVKGVKTLAETLIAFEVKSIDTYSSGLQVIVG